YAPPKILGRIEFDGVSFKYERNQTVLDNFSLTINPGETIAIVGPSGAGKSTIVHLLLRFYEPDAGAIRIDGYPINALKLSYLRKNIGLVIQDPILFSGSVRDNIAYGKRGAGQEEIIQSAKAANAHEVLLALHRGQESEIAENATHRGLLHGPRAYIQRYQNQLQAQTQVIPSQFRGYKYLKKEEKP